MKEQKDAQRLWLDTLFASADDDLARFGLDDRPADAERRLLLEPLERRLHVRA
jgi:hypothetical protein